MRAPRLCRAVCGGLLLGALGGCELIAGYNGLKPWQSEAGAEEDASALDGGADDDDAAQDDVDAAPADVDAAPVDVDAGTAAHDAGRDAASGVSGDAGADAASDASEPSAEAGADAAPEPDAAVCSTREDQDVCTALPRFTANQVVDGAGDEFCDIPAKVFAVVACPTLDPSTPPALPGRVVLRVAWSTQALHLHMHVSDPTVIVQADPARLWNGDAVEIYIAGASGADLHGVYTGTDDGGAVQLVLAPPSAPFATRGEAFLSRFGAHSPIDPALYAGRLVADGYELELRYPWAASAAPALAAGRVAFDLAINVQDRSDAGGRELQCMISSGDVFVDGSEACGLAAGEPAQPYCDDRTWCQPQLSP
jgi:hypothetical protein